MTAPLSTDEATALLTSILMDPQWSVDSIADLPKDDPFGKLCYDLAEIRAHVQALSKGDLREGARRADSWPDHSSYRGQPASSYVADGARRAGGLFSIRVVHGGFLQGIQQDEPGDAQQGRGASRLLERTGCLRTRIS